MLDERSSLTFSTAWLGGKSNGRICQRRRGGRRRNHRQRGAIRDSGSRQRRGDSGEGTRKSGQWLCEATDPTELMDPDRLRTGMAGIQAKQTDPEEEEAKLTPLGLPASLVHTPTFMAASMYDEETKAYQFHSLVIGSWPP